MPVNKEIGPLEIGKSYYWKVRIWEQENGLKPSLLAGHSLGEYSALVSAGGLDFLEAVALVAKRGELMQSAVPEGTGAMAAILGLEADLIDLWNYHLRSASDLFHFAVE